MTLDAEKTHLMELLSNIAGLIGVALLAVPAFHVNRYALLIASISSPKVNIQSEAATKRRSELVERLGKLRDSWQPWKAWCLAVGTACAALSYVFAILAKL